MEIRNRRRSTAEEEARQDDHSHVARLLQGCHHLGTRGGLDNGFAAAWADSRTVAKVEQHTMLMPGCSRLLGTQHSLIAVSELRRNRTRRSTPCVRSSKLVRSQQVASGEEVNNLRHELSQFKGHITRLCTLQSDLVRPKVHQKFHQLGHERDSLTVDCRSVETETQRWQSAFSLLKRQWRRFLEGECWMSNDRSSLLESRVSVICQHWTGLEIAQLQTRRNEFWRYLEPTQ